MNTITKYIFFQVMIILPFVFGYYLDKSFPDLKKNIKKIIRFNLIFLEPLLIFWSIWGLKLTRDLVILPLTGLFLVLSGFWMGKVVVPFFRHPRKKAATYLICSSTANHGFTMGGFLCYLVLGEKGLALSFIFLLYFTFYVYLFLMPFAHHISKDERYSLKMFADYLFNFQNLPLLGGALGIILSLLQIKRPAVYFPLEPLLIVSIILYFFSLGLTFQFKDINRSLRENLSIALTKFFLLPLTTFLLFLLIPIDQDLKKIILIQSITPVGVYSVLVSALYDLDLSLASSIFVVNTILFLIGIFPFLLIVFHYIF